MVFRRKVITVKRTRPNTETAKDTDASNDKRIHWNVPEILRTDSANANAQDAPADEAKSTNDSSQQQDVILKRSIPNYTAHIGPEEMQQNIAAGRMLSGVLRTSRRTSFYGHVLVTLGPKELARCKEVADSSLREQLNPFTAKVVIKITLPDAEAINRSFNGDTVCLEVCSETPAVQDSSSASNGTVESVEENMEAMINQDYENDANDFYESHHPTSDDTATANQPTESEKTVESATKKGESKEGSKHDADPYITLRGKVRGILSQSRRSFCGSLVGFIAPDAIDEPQQEKETLAEERSSEKQRNEKSLRSTFANAQSFQSAHGSDRYATDNFFFFQPYSAAYPRMRLYLSRSVLNSMPLHTLFRTRFLVRFTEWEVTNTFPTANVVSVIGDEGDINVEEKVVLFENNIIDSVNISTHENNNYAKDEVQRIVEKYYKEVGDAKPSTSKSVETPYMELFRPFFERQSAEEPKRHNLRHLTIFSIDPQGCKDIDDALHCMPVDKEKFRREILSNDAVDMTEAERQLAANISDASEDIFYAGIHIADVSHYVQEESKLDLEARRRGTSVYLVNKRINMLPSTLSEFLCSLQANEERFCFSVMFFITSTGEILTSDPSKRDGMQSLAIDLSGIRIAKTIIRSSLALSYEQAHEILEVEYGQSHELSLMPDPQKITPLVRASLVGLHRVSAALRNTRERSGAIFLSSPEFRFVFEENANPFHPSRMVGSSPAHAESEAKTHIDTHALIEEYMLLGNSIVARTMLAYYPQHALLRNHLPPVTEKTESQTSTNSMFDLMNKELALKQQRIIEKLRASGDETTVVKLHIDVSSSLTLNASLSESCDPLDPDFNHFLKLLVTRAMTRAQYIDSEAKGHNAHDRPKTHALGSEAFTHYGLALPCYTHFTSPIRRYADLVVHRLLGSIFNYNAQPSFMSKMEVDAEDQTADVSANDASQIATTASIYSDLTTLTAHLNTQHEKAQTSGRDSQKFFCKLYLIGLPDLAEPTTHIATQGHREKLVLQNVKGYVIRKGKARGGRTDDDAQEVIVMIPEINIEGELIDCASEVEESHDGRTGENNSESRHSKFNLFEYVPVDVWVVAKSESGGKGKPTGGGGPQIEIRVHRGE